MTLKEALAERLRDRPAAEVALAEHDSNPDVWQAPLGQYLNEVGVDQQLTQLAERLLQLSSNAAPRQVNIDADTIQGQQVGDYNTQANTFGS